jgi:predicted nucleic acid-binding protein
LIALLSDWHEHHERTLAAYERLLSLDWQPVISVQALLECFSILTRLPAPLRLAPSVVETLIVGTWRKSALIAEFGSASAWTTLALAARRGFGGGRVYDAVIAIATQNAGATLLLTWNVKHFGSMDLSGLDVREPE